MHLDDYQKEAKKTAIYPDQGKNYIYAALGLAGEAGEVADKVKKVIRDSNWVLTEQHKQDIQKEIGDVLWYAATLATELGISLSEIAKLNLQKLQKRQQEGKLQGSGDNR